MIGRKKSTQSSKLLTLDEAFEKTLKENWSQTRDAGLAICSQTRSAVQTLKSVSGDPRITVGAVTLDHLLESRALWLSQGLAVATANHRLGALSVLGVDVSGARLPRPRHQQWHLKPEDEKRIAASYCGPGAEEIKDYVRWTTRTGLRVEETLRLRRHHFSGLPDTTNTSITVPGTKTYMAGNITLPIMAEAAEVAAKRLKGADTETPLFDLDYKWLLSRWQHVRLFLGVQDIRSSTLKALRRSATRYLHIDRNMPLDMVREYLRHENIKTTMGYLRLVGYRQDEMRRWL